MPTIIQAVGWLVSLQGIWLGMLAIAVICQCPAGATNTGRVVSSVVVGVAPILAGLVALRNPRIASKIDLWVASIGWICFSTFHWGFGGILPAMAVYCGAIVIPGLFWFLAARRNWNPPLRGSPILRHTGIATALGGGVLSAMAVFAFFVSLGFPWWDPIGDCGGRPLVDERGSPIDIDFTARIVFVGPRTLRGYSLWSIAEIEERYGDVDSWANLIILKGGFQPSDRLKRYFVEGSRGQGVFSYVLPIIEPVPCGRTGRREQAEDAISILRRRPAKSDAH